METSGLVPKAEGSTSSPQGNGGNEQPRFRHYTYRAGDPGSLSGDTVHVILVDRRGTLWVGTNSALDHLEPSTSDSAVLRHKRDLPGAGVYALHQDSLGRLWVGLRDGFCVLDSNGRRMVQRFSPAQTADWGVVRGFAEDADGRIWSAGAGPVGTIAYSVGFKSVSHFSNRFQDRFGVRPSVYRAEYAGGGTRRP